MVLRDVVTSLLHRLGMVGVTMVASALILGAIAGGVVVHRLQSPAASSKHESVHSGQEPTPGQTQNRQANAGHHDSQKQGDEQDKDA